MAGESQVFTFLAYPQKKSDKIERVLSLFVALFQKTLKKAQLL